MRIITVEEHYMSLRVNEEYNQITPKDAGPQESAKAEFIQKFVVEKGGGIAEIGAQRIAYMDKSGVDIQIIGYGNNNPMDLNPTEAISLCKMANDDLAAAIKQHPSRFYGFATLPVGNIDEACKELDRCVNTLGFKGAMFSGTYQGKFFDSLEFFRSLKRLHICICLFQLSMNTIGAQRILWSMDHPYMLRVNTREYLSKNRQKTTTSAVISRWW